MKLVKRFVFIIVGVVVFSVVYSILAYNNYNKQGYDEYKNNRDLFRDVKDEAFGLVREHGYSETTSFFRTGGNSAIDQYHIDTNKTLKNNIDQILELSSRKLSFLKYTINSGEHLVIFVFDWEGAYGKTYHIVYCENYDAVVEYYTGDYDGSSLDIKVTKLDKDWYGVLIK